MNTFKKIYLVFLIIVFTSVLLFFTYPIENKSEQLHARLIIGGSFTAFGFIFMRGQKSLGKFFYERQIELIKKRTSIEKAGENWKYAGTFMLSTGIIVIIVGLIMYSI